MILRSPAKLNLGLSIVGRDSRDYHLLESLFWPIELQDHIKVEPAPELHVSLSPATPSLSMEQNLVTRACRWAGIDRAAIHIDKNIPIGAGLGGGSSNAGTVLRHFRPDLEAGAAVSLGADVPFFLNPRPTWVTGTGEKLQALRGRVPLRFLLVLPSQAISTAEIFAAYRQSSLPFSPPRSPFESGELRERALLEYLRTARNDLEPVVAERYPIIANILAQLRQTPCLYAGLSGTGSTCFAAYPPDTTKEVLESCRFRSCRSVLVNSYSEE